MRWRSTFHLALVLTSWVTIAGASHAVGQEAEQAPAPAGGAQQPAAAADRAGDPAKMDDILKKWAKQSTLLKTLEVIILRTDDTPAWGTVEYYEGRALFKSPNLAFIDFKKIKTDDQKRPVKNAQGAYDSEPNERIVCTGTEVWQYKCDTKQIFIFPLEKNDQKKAIEEGPLPFLFNMRADDAKRRYDMTFIKEDPKADAYIVRIVPKLKEDMESFSTAFISLDRKFMLPVRILMLSPDGKSKKDFKLGPLYPNKKLNENNFVGKTVPAWKLIRNPMGDQRQPAPGAAPRRPAPAAARRGNEAVPR
ncbi:outer membrane lipoprotein-sorting protein [Aquisphaera insulae]|uniref:outer membrane lipoprotein-sorting protein n=1 Tax=Aquisphaera insulae TaxID=2712864 RepID=UPI0013EC9350|nr:outer membrane lipoprotein-sorting protein [Aquisphaera insulae]